MKLNELSPAPGSRKSRRRLGRGVGSGRGKTAGRGTKGQNSRSGGGVRPGFEGGQMPIQRRLPKRGFTNIFRKEYQIINLKDLNRIEKVDKFDPDVFVEKGLVSKKRLPIKILGDGEWSRAIEIKANAFTHSAIQKIEAAGGKAIVI